jgi:hypothetical protein
VKGANGNSFLRWSALAVVTRFTTEDQQQQQQQWHMAYGCVWFKLQGMKKM